MYSLWFDIDPDDAYHAEPDQPEGPDTDDPPHPADAPDGWLVAEPDAAELTRWEARAWEARV